jgi:2,3-bisphosphoglycerate-dependent phosphoglycerate mutase
MQRIMSVRGALRVFPPAYRSTRNLTKFANEKDRFGDQPIQLTFLRHGQSTWNKENIFIGMTDTPLTEEGVVEAVSAGKMLAGLNAEFDCVYTSLLKRSTSTVSHVLREIDQEWIPVVKDWRLNERNYGALVGQNKKQCVAEHGKDQVRRWRRSWDEPPPPMSRDNKYWPYNDRRYQLLGIKEEEIPLSESLKDVTRRTSVFWDEVIVPQLRDRKRILIVGHENNLRSIIKRLDGISNEAIIDIELPRAIPLVYHLDPLTLRPMKVHGAAEGLSGRYLCTKLELQAIAERDFKQVYELSSPTGLPKAEPLVVQVRAEIEVTQITNFI